MKTRKTLLVFVGMIIILSLILSGFGAASTLANASGKSKVPPLPKVKNVIVMISDGWGYNQIAATSYYRYGKDGVQPYTKFPFRYAMSTYEAYYETDGCYGSTYDPAAAWSDFNYVVNCPTDSAAAATAMSTGVKTYGGAIGVDMDYQPLFHALDAAEEQGKATGVVTSVEFSHATPAGFVAHNVSRNDYSGIANEMIYQSKAEVIMGAGHPWYDADGIKQESPISFRYVGGEETWNDLIAGTAGSDIDGNGLLDVWTLIQSREEFQNMAAGETPARVIGVPQVYQTLQQGRSGDSYATPYGVPLIVSVPTLAEMTAAALNVLDDDPDGLFLMIEGGAVDWAGHANQSGRLIEEQIDFDDSVEVVLDWVKKDSNWSETLLIVTGDHETGYLNGPGSNPTWEPIVNYGSGELPGMEWFSGDHTNSLIPFYAKGKGAKYFGQMVYGMDPMRGAYIDNTAIGQLLLGFLGY